MKKSLTAHLVSVMPQINMAFASRGSLKGCRNTELHLVHALLEVQLLQLVRGQSDGFPESFLGFRVVRSDLCK